MESQSNSRYSTSGQFYGNEKVTKSEIHALSPSKTPRTHRIFKDESPRHGSVRSPPKVSSPNDKLSNSGATHDTRVAYSPQGCTLYYNEGIAISPPKIIDSLSPMKQHLTKSNQILEYENALLLRQLQERDDVINLFKKGWTPNTQPINESTVRSLNLQLSHKSVLIEQVHRNLEEFELFMKGEKSQISPMCMERFRTLKGLIHTHEHRPILISEKILSPVRMGQEWHIQMESSYQELTSMKEKLVWFERQNKVLESTINGLKMSKSQGDMNQIKFYQVEIKKFENQMIIFQQEISSYQSQINSLNIRIQELYALLENQDKNGELNKIKAEHMLCQSKIDEINNKNSFRLAEMEREMNRLASKTGELENANKSYILEIEKWRKHVEDAEDYIKSLLKQLEGLEVQNSDSKFQKENFMKLEEENSRLSAEITKLRSTIESMKLESSKLSSEYKTTLMTVETYKKEISSHSIRTESLLKEKDNEASKWQAIIKTKENEHLLMVSKLNAEIQELNQKIKASTNSDVEAKLKNEIESLKKQLAELKHLRENEGKNYELNISKTKEGYLNTINQLTTQIETYKSQITKLNSDQSAKIKEANSSIQISFEQKILTLNKTIDQYKLEIESYKKIKSQKEWELEIEKIKRDYEIKVNELWNKLTTAEDYIDAFTKECTLKIEALEKLLTEEKNKKQSDDYLYKVDTRFDEVGRYLMEISTKNSQISKDETEFWETFLTKRKKDMEEMQLTINNSLKTFTNIEQTVIVKREEMYRLDLMKLEDLVKEINVLKSNKQKNESAIREEIESKLYCMLKSLGSPNSGSSKVTIK